MQNIDFLPQRYRDQRTQRKTQIWRLSVLAMLGAVVAAAATGQFVLRRSVAAELQSLQGSHGLATARNMQHSNLQQQLAQAEGYAALYAYLQHPWPRTRILKELTTAVPDTVVLQQVSITPQARVAKTIAPQQRRRRQNTETATSNLPPAQNDFHQLQTRFQKDDLVARVIGVTSQASELHAFITRLNQSPLFVRAELTSLESVEEKSLSRLARFEVLVQIRPPHASEEAPRGPVEPREQATPPPAPPVHTTAADLSRSHADEEG